MPLDKQKPIVVVGSINMDLVSKTRRIPRAGETIQGEAFNTHPGGKGANQAVAVARLGWPVRMIGRVGEDAFGHELRANLESAGVDVSRVATCPGTSGVAVVLVTENGDNCIVISPGANSLLTPADLDAEIEFLRGAGLVLAQLEIPIETVAHLAQLCKREGVPLVLDPAPAYALPRRLLQSVAWFTPNEVEADFYLGADHAGLSSSEDSSKQLIEAGVHGVVLKLGARGAYLRDEEDAGSAVHPFVVDAVDTTAAGDAFNGAFATALMMGHTPRESARFATAAAALSVTKPGAQSSMPSLAEVQALLAQSR